MSLNVDEIKKDFPILQQKIHGQRLAFLDSAASSQKPNQVLNAMVNYYQQDHANVHRGVHLLSQKSSDRYENVRDQVQKFINAKKREEIIFVKGTTEAINLVAQTFGRSQVTAGDEVIISTMEHHANIIPWQMLCQSVGASLNVIPISDAGELDMTAYQKLLNPKVKLVAITHVSNVLGTINPVAELIQLAKKQGIPVLIDGAQAIPHLQIDVQALDCDFYTFSAHKMYGPTGIGVLYAKKHHLVKMPPYEFGGNMIRQVTFEKTEFADVPNKFEAGTPNIAGVVGFGAAIDYMNTIGLSNIEQQEKRLLTIATKTLSQIPGLSIQGTAKEKAAVISFTIDDIHAHDVSTILDQHGVAVRAGHHCCMPLLTRLGVAATTRASFAIYNDLEDIQQLVAGINAALEVFHV